MLGSIIKKASRATWSAVQTKPTKTGKADMKTIVRREQVRVLCGRITSRKRGAVEPIFLCAVLLGFGVSIVHGQWLEDSICIADALGGLDDPTCLAYDSVDNTVFVAGEGEKILVLDASDGGRLGAIPFEGETRALCYNPISNRVYALDWDRDVVTVIDAGTRTVLDTLAVGSEPCALVFNAAMNRVYCANYDDDNVTVVDGEGDSVIATIEVGWQPVALCWNPTRNVVYTADDEDNTVTVIDAAADTVIKTIDIDVYPTALLYNPDLNKLYITSFKRVTVIDGLADTVLAIEAAGKSLSKLCYNPANGKVYIADEDDHGRVVVLDCLADSSLGAIDCRACDLAYNARDNRLYMTDADGVAVADGATDSLLCEVRIGYGGLAVCVTDSGRRVFCTADREDLVGVLDCTGDSLLTLVGTDVHARPSALCFNPTANKAYCAVEGTNEVLVIDGEHNVVRQVLPIGWGMNALLYNPVGNKVYCVNSGYSVMPANLTVIDGSGDSILRTMATGPEGASDSRMLCLNPAGDRLYEAVNGDKTVTVFDAAADTIVCRVPLPSAPTALCYEPAHDYVYVTGSHAVDVIDAGQNIIVAEVDVGLYPVAICYVPVGAKVYTADRDSGTVSVVAGERPERVAQVDIGGYPCALAWDSHDNKVYCADGGSSVAVTDASTETLVARVPVGRWPYALCYDSLNNRVYCACRFDSSVAVIDCHLDSVIATIHVGAEPVAMAWNPIEFRTYVANYSGASISIIRDSLYVGVKEAMNDERRTMNVRTTVLRGVLFLPKMGTVPSGTVPIFGPSLLDVSGRKVLNLSPGANDVRALAPGVYFVRTGPSAVGRQPSAVTKVVVTR